jgi:hypothetical protein
MKKPAEDKEGTILGRPNFRNTIPIVTGTIIT